MSGNSTRTVVFDAVGTLIYPEPGVAAVYTTVGRRFGSQLGESEVAQRFRQAFGEVEARDRAGDLRTSEEFECARWQEIVKRVLPDVQDYDGCFAELWTHFAKPNSWQVFPEVPEVLAGLAAQGLKLAIASNFDGRLFAIAREVEPLSLCHRVLVSSQIGYRKPHRRFFETILATLGTPPGQVFYVGDDPHNDITGAQSVGMHAVLLDRGGATGGAAFASLNGISRVLDGIPSS